MENQNRDGCAFLLAVIATWSSPKSLPLIHFIPTIQLKGDEQVCLPGKTISPGATCDLFGFTKDVRVGK